MIFQHSVKKILYMNKIVPFKGLYDKAKLINRYSIIVLYISTFLTLIIYFLKNCTENLEGFIDLAIKVNCILAVGYIISNLFKDYILFIGRRKKRLDLIDNSFSTTISSDQSIGYFSNDSIKPGLYKLAINSFENTFFSLNIGKSMLFKTIVINSLIFLVFLFSAIFGLNNIVVLILQISLPAIMLKDIIKLVLFLGFLEITYSKYCSLFNDIKDKKENIPDKYPEMLSNILEYESILSWANILLSEKKYNELNSILSTKWEEIKIKYKIDN
jgi:hypothetical protein